MASKAMSKKSSSVIDAGSILDQDQTISSISLSKFESNKMKKGAKLVEIFKPKTKDEEKGKEQIQRPNPMGSNFNEIQPKPGIALLEGGKMKENKSMSKLAANKLSVEEYQLLKGSNESSLIQIAESRLAAQKQLGEKSFSLP